jgi:predicted ATPase
MSEATDRRPNEALEIVNIDVFVVISGCSSGGKSMLLTELGRRGYITVEEPGRRIVKEELACDGFALPRVNGAAFAQRAIALALADRAAVKRNGSWVFFDRGLIDAAAALQHLTGEPALNTVGRTHRYHSRVFLVPPRPEIYVTDGESVIVSMPQFPSMSVCSTCIRPSVTK